LSNGEDLEYKTSIQMLQHEGQLVWTRYSLFLAAHSLLIAGLIQLYVKTVEKPSIIELIHLTEWFCALGMGLCVLWSIVTYHGLSKCSRWITNIRILERKDRNLPKIWSSESGVPAGKKHILLHLASILAILSFLSIYYLTWRATSECNLSLVVLSVSIISIIIFFGAYYRDTLKAKLRGELIDSNNVLLKVFFVRVPNTS
jgi:hypothetical protein